MQRRVSGLSTQDMDRGMLLEKMGLVMARYGHLFFGFENGF
jgi:hypothetical protein